VGYIQVVLAALWGWLFLDEVPGALTLLGAAAIVGATLWLALARPSPTPPAAAPLAPAPAPRERDPDEDGILAG
jgi:drug/metabolite transporter (DMT)-like permease